MVSSLDLVSCKIIIQILSRPLLSRLFTVVPLNAHHTPHVIPADANLLASTQEEIAVSFLSSVFRTQALIIPPMTTGVYIVTLPPAHQRLLVAWANPMQHLSNLSLTIQRGLQSKEILTMASDGGLSNSIGTFGIVLAVGLKVIREGAGPADGGTTTANSKRPELAGYATGMEILLLICHLTSAFAGYDSISLESWVDNSAAGTFVPALKRPLLFKELYARPRSLAHIQRLWAQLPVFEQPIQWINARQDNNRPFKTFPLCAQLNITADGLATTYYKAMQLGTAIQPSNESVPVPHCPIILQSNGRIVTAQAKDSIRFHIKGTRMRTYLQKLYPTWTDKYGPLSTSKALVKRC